MWFGSERAEADPRVACLLGRWSLIMIAVAAVAFAEGGQRASAS